MIASSTETSARALLAFWRQSRLRVADARPPRKGASAARRERAPADRLDVVRDLLRVGYAVETRCSSAAGRWELSRWRTTPSAGALYPFELMAVLAAGTAPSGNYLYDPEQGELRRHPSPPLEPRELAEIGVATSPGSAIEALLVLLARPWLSMKKYGLRGYAYCHLDVGHAAANLALYATSLGHAPKLHLRFSRPALLRRLELEGLCREPLVALSLAAARTPRRRTLPDVRVVETAAPEPPGSRELESWETVREITSIHSPIPAPRVPSPTRPWADVRGAANGTFRRLGGRFSLPRPAAMRAAILGRRSAKGFRPDPLGLRQLGALLASIRDAELCCDAAEAPEIGLRVAARSIAGLDGVWIYDPRAHALIEVDRRSPDDDFGAACMRQEVAETAAALLLFHAPIRPLVDRWGYSAFAELHFHVAQLGQRLYLAAADAGVGVTCIGGFDEVECARLGRLAAPQEVLYVVACGRSDDSAVKHDRLDVAYSHGRTSLAGERSP